MLADKLAEPTRQTSYVAVFDNGDVAVRGTLSKDAQGTTAVGGQALHGVRPLTKVSGITVNPDLIAEYWDYLDEMPSGRIDRDRTVIESVNGYLASANR